MPPTEPAALTGNAADAAEQRGALGVLVVGADAPRRAKMLEELRGLLPEGTQFAEATETWQVLARARTSRMVILTGDLLDLSAQGLTRVLTRRHPLLPVLALGRAELGRGGAGQATVASL